MKKIALISLLAATLLFFAIQSFAGLINYERLRRFKERQDAGEKDLRFKDVAVPDWVDNLPRAKTEQEKRYDINKDGILQIAETKIFLRDVLNVVDQKGGYTLDSDILKEYDKNRDSIPDGWVSAGW